MAYASETVQDRKGNAVGGATITVVNQTVGGLASLFSDANMVVPIANPTSSDQNGFYEFYLTSGNYLVTETKTGLTSHSYTLEIASSGGGGGGGDTPFQLIDAVAEGAPGGTANDTLALLAVINAAPDWSVVVLGNNVYSVDPDAIAWNKQGIRLVAPWAVNNTGFLSVGAKPSIKILGDGGFGIKIGAASNYNTVGGPLQANALFGIAIDGNFKKFSDAMLVVEGQTKFGMSYVNILNSGQNTAGRYCRAVRMRVVWEAYHDHIFMRNCFNLGGACWYYDVVQTDVNGNCNNQRFFLSQFEQCDGSYFASAATSNLDIFEIFSNKFEIGPTMTGSTTQWLFDIDNCNRLNVHDNTFTNYITSKYAGFFRLGMVGSSVNPHIGPNQFSNCSSAHHFFGTHVKGAVIRDSSNNQLVMAASTNQSAAVADIELPIEMSGGAISNTGRITQNGHGFISIHEFSTLTSFIADTSPYRPPGGTLLRQTTVATGTVLAELPISKYADYPQSLVIGVRCRPTQDPGSVVARLGVICGGTTGDMNALAALPAAVTTISFTGDGTTATATKVAHGFNAGDRIIITLTTTFNTSVGVPAQILTIPTADTFTFASTSTGVAESGSAQLCTWQVALLSIGYPVMSGLGQSSSDRFRLIYGTANAQAIDIAGICFSDDHGNAYYSPALHDNAGSLTIPASEIINRSIIRTGHAAAQTDTSDTAIAIYNASIAYGIGRVWSFDYVNPTAVPITWAVGAGCTLSGSGIIAAYTKVRFRVALSSAIALSFTREDAVPTGITLLSGTWTPTVTAVTNIAATGTQIPCHYARVGDVVSCNGNLIGIDPTAAGAASLRVSLPIASNLANAGEVGGTAASSTIASQSGRLIGDTTNDAALMNWIAVDITSQDWGFSFSYRVI